MSQTNVEIPAAAPPVTAPAVAPPPAAPPAPAAAPELPAPPAGAEAWLKPRLERERASARTAAWKEAGFESEEDAKAAAKALREQREAEKAVAQKLAERDAELARVKSDAERLSAATREYAARMMFGLSDLQKKAVTDIAGDDPAAQIKAITVLTPTWAKEAEAQAHAQAQQAAQAQQPAAPAAAPATPPASPAAPVGGGNTAPGRTAPVGGEGSPANHRAVYDELRQKNPFAAARYGETYPEEIHRPKA